MTSVSLVTGPNSSSFLTVWSELILDIWTRMDEMLIGASVSESLPLEPEEEEPLEFPMPWVRSPLRLLMGPDFLSATTATSVSLLDLSSSTAELATGCSSFLQKNMSS